MRSTCEKSAKLIVEREKMLNAEDKSVIFVGDMNSQPNTPYSKIIRTRFTDTRDIAEVKSEVAGTMNGAEVTQKMPTRTIDYIYIRGGKQNYKVLSHEVLTNKYKVGDKMLFPSDHCPVSAKIELTN
jgi:endonuclease/exonuclease/phosphatase family metal-dependent hydrolase